MMTIFNFKAFTIKIHFIIHFINTKFINVKINDVNFIILQLIKNKINFKIRFFL